MSGVKLAVRLLFASGVALSACAGTVTARSRVAPAPVLDRSGLERRAFEAVNLAREKAGLPRLASREDLARIARAHSEYQARTGRTGHTGAGGSNPADRALGAGIAYRTLAENVAMNQGYADPVAVALDGWMRSAGHRKNILNPVFTETGVGTAVGADGEVYFTQLFLDPPAVR